MIAQGFRFRFPALWLGQKGGLRTWWNLDGGIPDPTGAYQSVGAASFADSLVNLANPGTYDLTVGNAPAWDAVNGWTGDGINDYLRTGITPADGWSAIVRFSGVAIWFTDCLFGESDGANPSARFAITPARNYQQGGSLGVAGNTAAGIMAIAGQQGYLNGVADGGAIPAWAGAAFGEIYLLARNTSIGAIDNTIGAEQAIAFYPYTLTGPNIMDLVARMAALP